MYYNVSVPIRGLFNLTSVDEARVMVMDQLRVSVPIRGLFNLTGSDAKQIREILKERFPSPLGDYLI